MNKKLYNVLISTVLATVLWLLLNTISGWAHAVPKVVNETIYETARLPGFKDINMITICANGRMTLLVITTENTPAITSIGRCECGSDEPCKVHPEENKND